MPKKYNAAAVAHTQIHRKTCVFKYICMYSIYTMTVVWRGCRAQKKFVKFVTVVACLRTYVYITCIFKML